MSKNVIATRIDTNGVSLAKQLFSSIHFNAGWKGDLLLLSHKVKKKDINWFVRRGILVKKCKPLYPVGCWPEYSASKLYLFTSEMKKWHRVIALDADIIVRGSLDLLTKINGFAAAPELDKQPLFTQFSLETKKDWAIFNHAQKKLNRKFNLYKLSFNNGVMAFSTNIITQNTFKKMEITLSLVKKIATYAEQSSLNLFFYQKWKELPTVYNLHPLLYTNTYRIKATSLKGINLHFSGFGFDNKPSNKKNPFYSEWKKNFDKAESIDRTNIPPSKSTWSKKRIWAYEQYLKLCRFLYAPLSTRLRNTFFLCKTVKLWFKKKYLRLYPQEKHFS